MWHLPRFQDGVQFRNWYFSGIWIPFWKLVKWWIIQHLFWKFYKLPPLVSFFFFFTKCNSMKTELLEAEILYLHNFFWWDSNFYHQGCTTFSDCAWISRLEIPVLKSSWFFKNFYFYEIRKIHRFSCNAGQFFSVCSYFLLLILLVIVFHFYQDLNAVRS